MSFMAIDHNQIIGWWYCWLTVCSRLMSMELSKIWLTIHKISYSGAKDRLNNYLFYLCYTQDFIHKIAYLCYKQRNKKMSGYTICIKPSP